MDDVCGEAASGWALKIIRGGRDPEGAYGGVQHDDAAGGAVGGRKG